MENYFGDIPLNADKVLFAEDLIYWFLRNNWYSYAHNIDRRDISNKVGMYRQFIYNGLNDKVKTALEFIDEISDCLVLRDFISMKNEDRVNHDSFIGYATSHHLLYFLDGFEARFFLIYCARLANMAGYFYVHGIKDVLHLAVECIVKGFPEGSMFTGTWDALNNAAEMFVKMEEDRIEALTPSSSSADDSDYSEDDTESGSSETDESNE